MIRLGFLVVALSLISLGCASGRGVTIEQTWMQEPTYARAASTKQDTTSIDISVGATIPNFGFIDRNGKYRQLSDYKGKYVLLDFWARACQGCIEGLPKLKAAYDKYRG